MMYQLKITLLSPTLVGSGHGYGSLIDTDIVFDELGLPYIPSRRIKGCLLDAMLDTIEMFKQASIDYSDFDIDSCFGTVGSEDPAGVVFKNLHLEGFEANKAWLAYFNHKYKSTVNQANVLSSFTSLRQQTKIGEDGVAQDTSLRTSRTLQKGLSFFGEVVFVDESEATKETLILACMNFRRFGTNRNRGFGSLSCELYENGQALNIDNRLEALCIA